MPHLHLRRDAPRLVLLVLLAAFIAGCGRTAKPFQASATADCLRGKGFTVSEQGPVDDPIAQSAANGALLATPSGGGNTLILSFAADGKRASDIQAAYRRFAPPKVRPHLGDIISTKRNAVLKWTVSPTSDQQAAVLGCLRS
jgi:hypothetical protein